MTDDLQARLSQAVQAALAPAARYVSALMQSGPGGSGKLLARPDLDAILTDALAEARVAAAELVQQAWAVSGGTSGPVIAHLLRDTDRNFDALPHLRGLIRTAHPEGPEAVRSALQDWARKAALRGRLSVSYAAGAAQTSLALADACARQAAGESLEKRWKRNPLSNSCFWCRRLDGVTIPLDADFTPYLGGPAAFPRQQQRRVATHAGADRFGQPVGSLIVYTKPPKPYHGHLPGPPLHPECRCRLEIVPAGRIGSGPPALPRSQTPEGFLSSLEVRGMPEDRYRSLLSFLEAAVHELREMLRRLAGRG